MLIEGLSSKRKREKRKKERKKGEQKLAFRAFFCARKNGDCSRKFRRHQDSGHDSSVCRTNGFAAQDQSIKCRFPRSALQTSPYDVRKTTKISTTCTYYREILTVRALRSSRTIEYYVLLSLRTIEKWKDWIWIGFQSGPAFFVRTIECTYYREMTVKIIGSTEALPILCVRCARWERERYRERERVRRKWSHLSSAEIGEEVCTFPCQNAEIGEEFRTFPCLKFAP